MNQSRQWATWPLVVLFCLSLIYILSIGPVAWFVQDVKPGDWQWDAYHIIYHPVLRVRDSGDESHPERNPIGNAISSYLSLWGGGPHDWLDM
jgi:hypothetical protein